MRSETGELSHTLWESSPGHGRESLDCGLTRMRLSWRATAMRTAVALQPKPGGKK